jgi:hypothetical protein
VPGARGGGGKEEEEEEEEEEEASDSELLLSPWRRLAKLLPREGCGGSAALDRRSSRRRDATVGLSDMGGEGGDGGVRGWGCM